MFFQQFVNLLVYNMCMYSIIRIPLYIYDSEDLIRTNLIRISLRIKLVSNIMWGFQPHVYFLQFRGHPIDHSNS